MSLVRWARPEERQVIQRYIFENMGKIPYERWANILDCRWIPENDRYGVVVVGTGRPLGFLGIVFADREIGGRMHRTGNITSWYLEKDMRRGGIGQEMLAMITEDPNVTYTATSPNIRSGSLLAKVGWETLDGQRLVWHRSGEPVSAVVRTATPEEVEARLGPKVAKAVVDHAGLNIQPYLIESPDGRACLAVTYVKLKGDDIAHHEVLHVSDRALFTAHAADFANVVLPPRKAVLSLDSRFTDGSGAPDETLTLEIPRYWKPAGLAPGDIDFLYSEVVLLDLKIQ
ncbi:MAG: GNAT family N-acetyltransferase [Parvibaculaceae bacterium]